MNEMKLIDYSAIQELQRALNVCGLKKEKSDMENLVEYIDSMQEKMNSMLKEIKVLQEDVSRLSNNGIKSRCKEILTNTLTTVQNMKTGISSVKRNLVSSAEKAIKAFREKGKSALIKAIDAMRIPSMLSSVRNGYMKASENMQRNAQNIDVMRNELHEMGTHLKNAGRTMFGKPTKQATELSKNSGILAKLRGMYQTLSQTFSNMEKHTENLILKIDAKREGVKEKSSIKAELQNAKRLKAKTSNLKQREDIEVAK